MINVFLFNYLIIFHFNKRKLSTLGDSISNEAFDLKFSLLSSTNDT